MDIVQKLVRVNSLLLQGQYQGAEHVLDSVIVDARELVAENARLQSIIDAANAQEPVKGTYWRDGSGVFTQSPMDSDLHLYLKPIPAQQSPAVAVPDIARYCGHDSLADMVSTHIHVWRTLLQDEIEINESETPFINHELNALADIEGAIKFDLEHPSPRITEQDAWEILRTCGVSGEVATAWWNETGRDLLNKLNGVNHE